MSDTISAGFLPASFVGAAWEEALEQLARPRNNESSLEGFRAGMGLRDLLSQYAYTMDQGDVDGIVGFFTDDCVINSPKGSVMGKAAIRAHFENLVRETPHRFHLFTNMVVRMAEDLQSGRITAYYLAVLQNDGEPPRTAAGLLADHVVKHHGAWKIRSRSVAVDITCGPVTVPDGHDAS